MSDIYIVTAYRWGDHENHSYVVGAYADQPAALAAAAAEEDNRGGKYECEVVAVVVGTADGHRTVKRTALETRRDSMTGPELVASCTAPKEAPPTGWQPHPAAADQPQPAGDGTDVILDLVGRLREDGAANMAILDLAGLAMDACLKGKIFGPPKTSDELHNSFAAALLARREKGIATYGVPLRTRNGRNARVDCAQELLDALVYAWQAHLEGEGR